MRNSDIDALKGIGIVCVLMGHVLTWGTIVSKMLFAFHVPLFFFLSGVFFKDGSASFRQILRRVCLHMVLPYFFFILIALPIALLRNDVFFDARLVKSVFVDFHPAVNGPVWFLVVLAMTHILFWLCQRILSEKLSEAWFFVLTAVLCIGCVIGSMAICKIRVIPFKFGVLPFSFPLFAVGYFLRERVLAFFACRKSARDIFFFSILCSLLALLAYRFAPSHVGVPTIAGGFLPSCIAGILATMYATRAFRLAKVRPLVWIGENSLFYFCLDFVSLPIVLWVIRRMGYCDLDVAMPLTAHTHGFSFAFSVFVCNIVLVTGLVFAIKPLFERLSSRLGQS